MTIYIAFEAGCCSVNPVHVAEIVPRIRYQGSFLLLSGKRMQMNASLFLLILKTNRPVKSSADIAQPLSELEIMYCPQPPLSKRPAVAAFGKLTV